MSKLWSRGSSAGWRKVRLHVLVRDSYRCRAHAEGLCELVPRPRPHECTGKATTAHHVRGRSVTGDDPQWIVAACAPCNGYIGDPTRGNPSPRPSSRW